MRYEVGAVAYAVAFSPDGNVLATGGAQSDLPLESNAIIRLWDVAGSRQITSWTTRGSYVTHLAFGTEGRTLISIAFIGGEVEPKCELRVWDLFTYREIGEAKAVDYPKMFPVTSPKGNVIAKHGGGGVLVIGDAETGRELYRTEADRGQLNCASFSQDGNLIAAGGGDTSGGGPSPIPWTNGHVSLWEVGSGRLLATYNRQSGPIEQIAFSPNGKMLASASLDGTVMLWAVPGR